MSATLIDVQRRYTRVGEIRLGERVSRGGKTYPSKLDTFRLTSKSLEVIKAAAARYGGTVERWDEGDGYQVVTDTASLPIMLPPVAPGTRSYSLAYETWSGGGLQRRCDGTSAMVAKGEALVESECLCDPDNRECKPILRLAVFLPEVAGFGTWGISSTGYNAAAELPGMLDLLASLSQQDRPIRAVLRLEQRTVKRAGKTQHFAVPVIDLPYSMAELTGSALPMLASNGHAPLPASTPVAVAAEVPAIAAGIHAGRAAEAVPATAPRTAAVVPSPEPSPAPSSDEPLVGDELQRWLAGTHAAMRKLDPDGSDTHAALRDLADTLLGGIGERSLNELTRGEWQSVARELRDQAQAVTAPSPVAAVVQSVPEAVLSSPAPAGPVEPDPEVEKALWEAALKHRLFPKNATGDAGWKVLDELAQRVFDKDPADVTPAEFTELAAQIAGGIHDPTTALPRRITP